MVELLQLLEAGLMVATVTLAAATVPVSIITGTDPPDITPLEEDIEDTDLYNTQQKTP